MTRRSPHVLPMFDDKGQGRPPDPIRLLGEVAVGRSADGVVWRITSRLRRYPRAVGPQGSNHRPHGGRRARRTYRMPTV